MKSAESETQARVLALVDRGQADQDALAARLSREDHAARGEPNAWSAKDQVAHNNFWRQDAVYRLQAYGNGGTPPTTDEDGVENLRTFQRERDTPWAELVAETRRIRAETAALIQQLSPEQLTVKDRYPWQDGQSMEILIFVNWYDHPAEHWADVYLSRNEPDRAIDLRQAVADTVQELFPHNPKLFSYMLYKLGVLCGRHGRSEQAIGAIRQALAVNPSLIEMVRQDTDLNPLRALPVFQAIEES